MTPEELFTKELEVFRKEEEAATQFFYAHLAIHAIAKDHEEVQRLLNKAPLFWNTCAGALQTATFIALGRIFDQKSVHNLDRVLRIAQDHAQMFTKAALAQRKQSASSQRPEWLDDFLKSAYEPRPADFRRLRTHVKKRRKIYEKNYRDVRNQFFAHKAFSDESAGHLFSKGNIPELQQLLTFLGSLYEALWELFHNGRRPVLRRRRYSVKRIRRKPAPHSRGSSVQEHILHDAETFFKLAAKSLMQNGEKPLRKKWSKAANS